MGCGQSRHLEAALEPVAAPDTQRSATERIARPEPTTNVTTARPEKPLSREDQAQAALLQGNALHVQKRYHESIKLFTKAISLNPNLIRAYYERGLSYQAEGAHEEAENDMNRVLRHQPDHVAAIAVKAECRMAAKDWDGALSVLNEAISRIPGERSLFSLRAECHRQTGHLDMADEDNEAGEEAEGHKHCVVCMEEERQGRLRPCMHACMCRDCALQLLARGAPCPICGVRIESVEEGTFKNTYAFDNTGMQMASPGPPRGSAPATPHDPSARAGRRPGWMPSSGGRDPFSLTPVPRARGTWEAQLDAIPQEPSASAFPGSANATSDDTPGASSVNGPSRELDGPEESTSTQYLPGDARPSVSQAESPALLHTGASPAASTPRLSPFAGRAGRAGEPRGEDAGAWSPEAGGSEMSFRMQAAATGASEGLGGGVARAHEGSRVGASGTGSDGGNVDGGRGDGQDGAATREHSPEGDKEGESAAPSVAGDADSRVESEVDAVLAALGDSVAMSDSLGLGGMQATLVA